MEKKIDRAIHECEDYVQRTNDRINRDYLISEYLFRIIKYKNMGGSISSALESIGIKRVALYGMGKIGKVLYDELSSMVVYTLDKKEIKYAGKQTRKPCDVTDDVDLIIITAVGTDDLIKEYLESKVKTKVWKFDEFFENISKPQMSLAGNIYDNYVSGELHGAKITFLGEGSNVYIGKGCIANGLHIEIGSNVKISIGDNLNAACGKWYFKDSSICNIGDDVFWYKDGHEIQMKSDSLLEIGSNSSFANDFFKIYSGDYMRIGSDCLFSRNVNVRTNDGHKIIDLKSGLQTNGDNRKVSIGDHVWIGENVLVLYNSDIGRNCIIGARSVVKGVFPDNCMIGGYMARIIKENVTWEK